MIAIYISTVFCCCIPDRRDYSNPQKETCEGIGHRMKHIKHKYICCCILLFTLVAFIQRINGWVSIISWLKVVCVGSSDKAKKKLSLLCLTSKFCKNKIKGKKILRFKTIWRIIEFHSIPFLNKSFFVCLHSLLYCVSTSFCVVHNWSLLIVRLRTMVAQLTSL